MSSYVDEIREWQRRNLPDHSRQATSKRLRQKFLAMTPREQRRYLIRRLRTKHPASLYQWELEEAKRLQLRLGVT